MARLNDHGLLAVSFLVIAMTIAAPAMAAESKAIHQFNRLVLKRDYGKSAAVLQAAANAGDAEAQFRLGNLYRIGLGVKQDEIRARNLLHQAGAAGNAKAKRLLIRLGSPARSGTQPIAHSGKGDLQLVIPTVKAGDTDGSGNSWLTRAAARGQISILTNLVTAETDMRPALLMAAAQGQNDAVMHLVHAGAPINTVDRDGRTVFRTDSARKEPAARDDEPAPEVGSGNALQRRGGHEPRAQAGAPSVAHRQ